MTSDTIETVYMDRIPSDIEQGKLYVSRECKVAIHLCACGCGEKVITPIDKQGWIFADNDGKPTLSPSIGNFEFPCKSHYFVSDGKIIWV